jgi:hypothetical protein
MIEFNFVFTNEPFNNWVEHELSKFTNNFIYLWPYVQITQLFHKIHELQRFRKVSNFSAANLRIWSS